MKETVKSPSRLLVIGLEKGLFTAGNPARERIVRQMAECGLERATILVFARVPFDEEIAPGIRVISTDSSTRLLYVTDALRIVWSLRKEGFDVVSSQDPVETGLVASLAAHLYGSALAVQDHGYYFHGNYYRKESFLNYFRYWFARWAVKRADAVRVVSLRTERALISLGIAKEKMVRFAVSPTHNVERITNNITIDDAMDVKDAGRDGRYFLLAARFVPIKRIDLAIHAFSLIASKHPDVKLLIVGRGTWDVGRKVEEFNLTERVRILPWTDQLQGLYQGAIATLITSDREGFGLTAVESLSNGTPVVMTDVGCAGEVVQDGVNGYIVPVGDVDALADRMERVMGDEGLRQRAKEIVYPKPESDMLEFYRRALMRYGKQHGQTEG